MKLDHLSEDQQQTPDMLQVMEMAINDMLDELGLDEDFYVELARRQKDEDLQPWGTPAVQGSQVPSPLPPKQKKGLILPGQEDEDEEKKESEEERLAKVKKSLNKKSIAPSMDEDEIRIGIQPNSMSIALEDIGQVVVRIVPLRIDVGPIMGVTAEWKADFEGGEPVRARKLDTYMATPDRDVYKELKADLYDFLKDFAAWML